MAMLEVNGKLRSRLLISLLGSFLFVTLWGASAPRLTITLMSDPRGADLRPYVNQVQKTIAKEWVRHWRPDWASEGRVILDLSIDRSGKVVEVVIASSSRIADLDKTAKDVVSACSPFPQVPEAFQGDQMKLQVNFSGIR